MLIDTHTHLEMNDYDDDRDAVIQRARDNGVYHMIAVGINLADSERACAIARQYDAVSAAVGIHPHDAEEIDDTTYDAMRRLAGEDGVVAYGEIGLDFFKNYSPRPVQIRRFGEQLELAHELGMPVIIHDRDAHRETREMLAPWRGRLRGVIHCFSGDYDLARTLIDYGFLISFTGTVTFAKASETRDIVRRLPLASIMVETDAPFLTPVPRRGKRNEPAYVVHVARKIAEIHACSEDEVAAVTTENAVSVFGVPGPPATR